MMQKIQRFGGAMMTPVLLFAFSGIMVGLGILFTNQQIFGALASAECLWYQCWNVILQGGWTLFFQVPLLFVVGLPIGLAKKQQARCCMEALVLYLTFQYFMNTMLSQWGGLFNVDLATSSGITSIAGIQTLEMGMVGALLISGIVIYIHNRFFDTELPEWLGTFRGSVLVFAIGFFALIPVAFLCCLVWPKIQNVMVAFQGMVSSAGAPGVWVFIFLERALIPFGLHHLLYVPFFYDSALVPGGVISQWAQDLPAIAASTESLIKCAPYAWPTLTGLSKVFGGAGITLAFYATAKPEKKKKALALLIPIGVTAVACGITEPLEFTFLFVAPQLFIVHALLAATLSTVVYCMGIVGVLSDGLISMAALNFIPLMSTHWGEYLKLFAVGLIFTAIYFFLFRFLIKKFDKVFSVNETGKLISSRLGYGSLVCTCILNGNAGKFGNFMSHLQVIFPIAVTFLMLRKNNDTYKVCSALDGYEMLCFKVSEQILFLLPNAAVSGAAAEIAYGSV